MRVKQRQTEENQPVVGARDERTAEAEQKPAGKAAADDAERRARRLDPAGGPAAEEGAPEQRQKQLRQLDRDLHDEDSATSARLQRVLERYAEWLDVVEVPSKAATG